ncbi:MAG: CPBP family intramembrane metalloprotease [Deltaproteobacteria bacterium]|nr:CPBP family intramembrane metalloprotease [Deltaproteobacteria bacterium]
MVRKNIKGAGHLSVFIYFFLFLVMVSLLWIFRNTKAGHSLNLLLLIHDVKLFVIVLFLGGGIIFISVKLFDMYDSSGLTKNEFMEMSKSLNDASPFTLALTSSLAEEFLFRGLIQYVGGYYVQAIFFGFMHWPSGKKLIIWPVWALLSGSVFGLMVSYTGSIWGVVIVHFAINLTSLRELRKDHIQ